jgi:hypothetical protein
MTKEMNLRFVFAKTDTPKRQVVKSMNGRLCLTPSRVARVVAMEPGIGQIAQSTFFVRLFVIFEFVSQCMCLLIHISFIHG